MSNNFIEALSNTPPAPKKMFLLCLSCVLYSFQEVVFKRRVFCSQGLENNQATLRPQVVYEGLGKRGKIMKEKLGSSLISENDSCS